MYAYVYVHSTGILFNLQTPDKVVLQPFRHSVPAECGSAVHDPFGFGSLSSTSAVYADVRNSCMTSIGPRIPPWR